MKIYKSIVLILLLLSPMLVIDTMGQESASPKWVSKVQKNSIVSVVTYDKEKNILHSGTAFFINESGVAIADLSVFRDAWSGVVIDMGGKKYDVKWILGADESYSLVKFKVDTKKSVPVRIAANDVSAGSQSVYALNFAQHVSATCPTTMVTEVSPLDSGYVYLTLNDSIAEKYIGCPLFNSDGEVIGTVQPSIGAQGFAISAGFFDNLNIQAIGSKGSTMALNSINIIKGLPDTMEEALVYLYFKSRSASNDEYLTLLNEFISLYPNNAEGYLKRATPLADLHRFDEADKDLTTYLDLAQDKARAHSSVAEVIYTKLLYMPEPAYEKWTYEKVKSHVDMAIDLAPDDLSYKLQKGQVLLASKDYDAAVELYDAINHSDNRSPATYYAQCLAHEGRGDSATVQIALLDSALVLFGDTLPPSATTYILRKAKLCESAGQYRVAVRDMNTYEELMVGGSPTENPELKGRLNAQFYYDRSQMELNGRMYQQCIDDLTEAIRQQPTDAFYHLEKSAVHLRVNQIDESIAEAQEAVKYTGSPTDDAHKAILADAYRIMGYAMIQKGDKESGKKYLEQAVGLGDTSARELIDTYLK